MKIIQPKPNPRARFFYGIMQKYDRPPINYFVEDAIEHLGGVVGNDAGFPEYKGRQSIEGVEKPKLTILKKRGHLALRKPLLLASLELKMPTTEEGHWDHNFYKNFQPFELNYRIEGKENEDLALEFGKNIANDLNAILNVERAKTDVQFGKRFTLVERILTKHPDAPVERFRWNHP